MECLPFVGDFILINKQAPDYDGKVWYSVQRAVTLPNGRQRDVTLWEFDSQVKATNWIMENYPNVWIGHVGFFNEMGV